MSIAVEEDKRDSIVLLGMPGSGKTTLGKQLAKHLELPFIDTDNLIEIREGRSLQNILDRDGYVKLRAIEEQILLNLDFSHSIVSTGGSVVYSDRGMKRIKQCGPCVYLNVPVSTLISRIDNFSSRGIAAPQNYSLEMIFSERELLYKRYADVILDVEDEDIGRTLERLIKKLIDSDSIQYEL